MPSLIAFRRSLLLCILAVPLAAACAQPSPNPEAHEPITQELLDLLDGRPELEDALTQAIASAGVEDIADLDGFYRYIDDLVTWIPDVRVASPRVLGLHYVINQAPGDALNEDEAFSTWLRGVADAWGQFLDTPASAPGIASFAERPEFNIADYIEGPSGWQTFNQFFAREVRPGKRPVAAPDDDRVLVSAADAIFMGSWPIDDDSTITIKGAQWRVADLLDGSPYSEAFANGTYMHSFLNVNDYHRYHLPVGGTVKEVRNVHGRVYLDVVRQPDGSLASVNGDTYQFNQERGLVVVESAVAGLVALVPVGMTMISSVTLTPDVGSELRKGDPFGYFQFGGSDMVMLFQNPGVVLEADVGQKYLQGQRIGRVNPR